jgi:multicomponent Na+:H+ antiporter subunit D
MRRILAYSIVNQVGFMVTGVGIGTEMALNGVAAHAFTHIIYKGLLLMSAGSVLYMTGRRKCTDLGGLFQSMPLTAICSIIGALSISSFPLTSGFISKSMISQAAADESLTLVWFMLMAASAGVFLHAGIKFPWFVFFQKDSGLRPSDPPWSMRLAMILFASICIGLGVWPEYLYAMLPYEVTYVPYTVTHVVQMLQLLLFSGFAFFIMLPLMKRTLTITLDFDWTYRRFFALLLRRMFTIIWKIDGALRQAFLSKLDSGLSYLARRNVGASSLLSRDHPAGSMVIWVTVLLAIYLLMSFIG